MTEISRLVTADQKNLDDINALIQQLSERLPLCTLDLLQKIVTDKNLELWILRDGERIIGMATLAVVVIPEGERGQIEDVVVHNDYRGKGLGKELSEKLIERAKSRGIRTLSLSSRADRVAANELYKKLGFEEWPTNVYRLKL